MTEIIVGTYKIDELIEELKNRGIEAHHGRQTYRKESTELRHKADELYKKTEEFEYWAPMYLECDTDDVEMVQNLYRELIEDQPEGDPRDRIPMTEGERKYLNECTKRYYDEFEEKYGYRPECEPDSYI